MPYTLIVCLSNQDAAESHSGEQGNQHGILSLGNMSIHYSSGPVVFLRSLLRSPATVGAVIPSSPGLSQMMVSQVDPNSAAVLEIGAGTGPVTRAILDRGLEPERLFVIERDPNLVAYLRRRFPRVRVMCGDALHAKRILADASVPPVSTIVSSLPIRNLNDRKMMRTVKGILNAMAPGGQLIQFTYAPSCPIPSRRLGLRAERLGRVWMNIPPATVWRFNLDGRLSTKRDRV
jgi:phosphatidylethanolamine/phosphatidyl-N-methylethanolamine N-methyltransferase